MKKKVSFVEWQGAAKNNEIFNNKYNWESALKEILEKNNMEISTSDLIRPSEADYVVFFDNLFYKNLDTIWDLYYNRKLENSVYIDFEPPTGHCKNHSKKGIKYLSNIFNRLITYNDDYIKGNIVKGNIADFYCKENIYKNDFNERKYVAMITNNTKNENIIGILNFYNSCDYYNKKNIHTHKHSIYHMREEAVKYFFNNCPNDFDLYGTLWDEKYNNILKGYIKQEKKYEVLSSYKYIISFDSFVDQRGYISEKIFDCFMAKTVPIYLGASNVTDYIPEDCFIDMRNFKTFKDLDVYLKNISEERYNEYIENIEKFLRSKQFLDNFSSVASANKIYNALMADSDNFSYKKAYKSLMYFQKKKEKVLKKRKINFVMSNSDNYKFIQLEFSIYDYLFEKNSFLEVYINGKKRNDINIERKESEDNVYYRFVVDLNYVDCDYVIQIKYKSDNGEQWLKFVDFSPQYSHLYGVSFNYKRDKLYYYCINTKKGYEKFKTLFKYNKKECFFCIYYYISHKNFIEIFKNIVKSNKYLYKSLKILQKSQIKIIKLFKIILNKIKKIIINIVKLPYRIYKEFISIFE